MTADAKVGLLLGLFFIVIIAFLVNGLPNFIEKEKPSTPPAAIPAPTAEDIVLDDRVTQAVHRLYPSRVQPRQAEPSAETEVVQPAAEPVALSPTPQPTVQEQSVQTSVAVNPESLAEPAPTPATAPKLKSHVVASGENLALIAQKYYGSEEGNRRAVIQKLFEANSGVLKSPDRVCVGDKLIIPPPETPLKTSRSLVKAPDPSKELMKTFPETFVQTQQKPAKKQTEYVVQSGDSLWGIAEEMLGDGNRYKEIVQFNKSTISSADDLRAGMRIVIPPK